MTRIRKERLHEGRDFIYDEEIIDVVTERLRRLGLFKEDLLVCGHVEKEDDQAEKAERTSFFAHTFKEYASEQAQGNITPVQFASERAFKLGGKVALSIYDPDKVNSIGAEEYEVSEGSTLLDATVAVFYIENQ
jgi:hypothetical protein